MNKYYAAVHVQRVIDSCVTIEQQHIALLWRWKLMVGDKIPFDSLITPTLEV